MDRSSNQIVKFLDVGHGDSVVIYLKAGDIPYTKTVVVDVPKSEKLLNELRSADIKTIDLLIITHFDLDHCGGVNDFLKKFSGWGTVEKICYNLDRSVPTKKMGIFLKRFLELYRGGHIQITGGELDTDKMKKVLLEWGNSKLYLIYPNKAESTEAYISGKTNNMSIITLLKNHNYGVLFSGDLEKKGWSSLLNRMPGLTCEILKMPHHGAYFKGTRQFLDLKDIMTTVSPKTAIISVGENKKYHHPDKRTIELLKSMGIHIFCTQYTDICLPNEDDICRKCFGDITISDTDKGYEVTTEQEKVPLCPICER